MGQRRRSASPLRLRERVLHLEEDDVVPNRPRRPRRLVVNVHLPHRVVPILVRPHELCPERLVQRVVGPVRLKGRPRLEHHTKEVRELLRARCMAQLAPERRVNATRDG